MFLPGFSTLGSPGGHEGEKRVTVSYSILVHHSRWPSFRMHHFTHEHAQKLLFYGRR